MINNSARYKSASRLTDQIENIGKGFYFQLNQFCCKKQR